MASTPDNISMALFCDFENVALGVRDANYEKFDIKRVLERLLLKGSIVVKKAYCDWDRYKAFKAPMHEANFELIEIPHVRQSGKNSADIRLVVDALDLCYTKSHVNTFVIISGDSDFSPLVSKLRENAKYVIGVGVKQSTSDLLIANCDEFIFYDDLVRESQRNGARRDNREAQANIKRSPEDEKKRREEMDVRRNKAIDMAVETFDALVAERGDGSKIWASVLKEAIKRRNPGFNESYYGFKTFGNLLEEAHARGLLEFGRDEKSGAYASRLNSPGTSSISAMPESAAAQPAAAPWGSEAQATRSEFEEGAAPAAPPEPARGARPGQKSPARRGRGGRHGSPKAVVEMAPGSATAAEPSAAEPPQAPAMPAMPISAAPADQPSSKAPRATTPASQPTAMPEPDAPPAQPEADAPRRRPSAKSAPRSGGKPAAKRARRTRSSAAADAPDTTPEGGTS